MPPGERLGKELTAAVKRVFAKFGLGYRATTYQGLVRAELESQQMEYVEDPKVPLAFAESSISQARARGFLIEGSAFMTVNALSDQFQAADRAILKNYLRGLNLPWGLAANFGKRRLEVHAVGI